MNVEEFTLVRGKQKNIKGMTKQKKNPWKSKKQSRDDKQSHLVALPFSNITILGDSHARHVTGLVKELVSPTTVVAGVCKPGAGLLNVTSPSATKTSPDHCYVLIAGSNDVSSGNQNVLFSQMEAVIQQYSRAVVCTLPLRHDLITNHPVNRTIRQVNNFITELCSVYKGVSVLDVGCLRRQEFTTHGMHLRACGKRHLARMITLALSGVPPPPHYRPVKATEYPTKRAASSSSQKPGGTVPRSYAEAMKQQPPVPEAKEHRTTCELPEPNSSFLGLTATVSSSVGKGLALTHQNPKNI